MRYGRFDSWVLATKAVAKELSHYKENEKVKIWSITVQVMGEESDWIIKTMIQQLDHLGAIERVGEKKDIHCDDYLICPSVIQESYWG